MGRGLHTLENDMKAGSVRGLATHSVGKRKGACTIELPDGTTIQGNAIVIVLACKDGNPRRACGKFLAFARHWNLTVLPCDGYTEDNWDVAQRCWVNTDNPENNRCTRWIVHFNGNSVSPECPLFQWFRENDLTLSSLAPWWLISAEYLLGIYIAYGGMGATGGELSVSAERAVRATKMGKHDKEAMYHYVEHGKLDDIDTKNPTISRVSELSPLDKARRIEDVVQAWSIDEMMPALAGSLSNEPRQGVVKHN